MKVRETKTPGIPDIRDDNVLAVLRAIKSTLEVREGHSGDQLDQNVTYRNLTELGFRAVCLFPAMHHVSLYDYRVTRIVETVAQIPGAAIFIHCGALSVGVRQKLGLPSHFHFRLGNPMEVSRLALAFPKVPFIIPHFGAGLFREALMAADLCSNIYFDTSSTNRWTSG